MEEKLKLAAEIINRSSKVRIVEVRYHGDIDVDFVVTEPFYIVVKTVIYGIIHMQEDELAHNILDVIVKVIGDYIRK